MNAPSDAGLAGLRWKSLEIEEQARVRNLMRLGRARIVGSGPDRFVEVFVGAWVGKAAEVRS